MKIIKYLFLTVLAVSLLLMTVLFIGWLPTAFYHKTIEKAIENNERPFGLMAGVQYEYNGIKQDYKYDLDEDNYIYAMCDENKSLVFAHIKEKNGRYKCNIIGIYSIGSLKDINDLPEKDKDTLLEYKGDNYYCYYVENELPENLSDNPTCKVFTIKETNETIAIAKE